MGRSKTRNLRTIFRQTMLESDDLQSLVGGRIFGSFLEDDQATEQLGIGPLVSFQLLSGSSLWHGYVSHQTMEVYAWSKESIDEAAGIYDVVFELLQNSRVSASGIPMCGLSREVQRPVDGKLTSLDAYYVRGRWNVSTASS